VELNPDAFVGANPHRLRSGATICWPMCSLRLFSKGRRQGQSPFQRLH
jgi:Tfp pilus assembly protein FimV